MVFYYKDLSINHFISQFCLFYLHFFLFKLHSLLCLNLLVLLVMLPIIKLHLYQLSQTHENKFAKFQILPSNPIPINELVLKKMLPNLKVARRVYLPVHILHYHLFIYGIFNKNTYCNLIQINHNLFFFEHINNIVSNIHNQRAY